MATKAEVLAAIELINKAVNTAAAVAASLEDVVALPPAVVLLTEPSIFSNPDGSLLILTPVGIDTVKWTLVYNDGESHPWYGTVSKADVPCRGLTIMPMYEHDTDFVKVMWDVDGMTNYKDGPKNTVAKVIKVEPTPIGVAANHKFTQTMLFGMNQERKNFLNTTINGATAKQKEFYDYYTPFGINWHRFFVPTNYTMNRGTGIGIPEMHHVDDILDACQAANLGRYPTVFGCLDVLDGAELEHWDEIIPFVDRVALRVQERAMDPTLFTMETANEFATRDNAFWNPRQAELYNTIRNRLPNHRIVVGGCDWNSANKFDDTWTPPQDSDYIIQFHHYESRDEWDSVTGKMRQFGALHNVPIICGELNGDFNHMNQERDQQRWGENFISYGKQANGIPAAAWANIGQHNDFRMNRSSTDGRLTSHLEKALKTASNAMRVR